MEPTEKQLEDRLKDLGIRLASPPSGVDELLRLLDQTEIYLSRVDQSPSTSMSDALSPIMNSLITNELLNHPETNVKVFVAACINEIIRITAPDAPYSDSFMKDIFAVIVDVFEKLDDISGLSYSKRVSILETVAKVRSCVVMLDLECDDLILQMFKHFLKSIRPDHSINIFSSMETIMTLVLEESENISIKLLFCLLSNVHKSKKDVMPVACRLAETVIINCAMKLKPYLLAVVKLMGICLGDYVDKVASICQECSVAPEQNEVEENKLPERTVHSELPQEYKKPDKPEGCFEELGAFADNARKVLSNGLVPLENENPVSEPVCSKFKHENSSYNVQCGNNIAPKTEDINFSSINEKPGHEVDSKHVDAKSSSVQSPDASDSSRVEDDMEASSPTTRIVGRKRKVKSLKSDMALETEVLLEPEREVEHRPLEGLVGDNKCVISATASDNLLGRGRKRHSKSLKSDDASDIAPKSTGILEPEREVEFPPLEGQIGDSSRVEDDMEASSPTTRIVGRKRKVKSLKSDMALETEVLLEPEREVGHRPLEGLVGDYKCVISATASDNLLGRGRKRHSKSLKSDDASDIAPKTTGILEPEREVEFPPLEGQIGDSTCVISAAACKDLPGSRPSKRGKSTKSQFNAKRSTPHKTALSSGKKEMFENTPIEKEGSLAIVSEHKEDHCAVSNFENKPFLDSSKKSLEDNAIADVSTTVVTGEMSLKEEQKEHVKKTEGISFRKQWKSSIKQPKFKDAAEGDISAEPCLKEMIISSKASREADNDENNFQKFVDTSSTKKSRRKTSGWKIHTGRKIEVWWPDDEKFYKAVIELFDPVTKKHKLVYEDGDVEHLFLRNERWNYIDSENFEKGHEDDNIILESSLQVPKKPKNGSEKFKATPERGRSDGKSKGTPIQLSDDKKPAVKSKIGSKRETLKVGTSSNEKTERTYGGDGTKVDVSPQENIQHSIRTQIQHSIRNSNRHRRTRIQQTSPNSNTTKNPVMLSVGTQTDITELEYNTPSVIQEKHKEDDALKLSSRSAKTRKKKETPTATTDGIIDIKNSASGGTEVADSVLTSSAVGSQRSAAKPNKRRRK